MKSVFVLEHVYEKDDIDEIKFIGIFTTYDKANNAIQELKEKPGFRDHPIDFFEINECFFGCV